jgi:HAD superfamily hydrolase (TIGR01459 family)
VTLPPIIDSLDDISARYDAVFCDLWGCLHDGVTIHPAAAAALQRYRAQGGVVALFTNAPRPAWSVIEQLAALGAPDGISDLVVSSGDASRESVRAGDWGDKVHFIGAERDLAFFEGLSVTLVPMEDAQSVICTGLRDDMTEVPEDYADELRTAQLRRLPMLNANPDVVVDKGDKRLWCSGALARDYEAMGGTVRTFGKPHAPIYDHGRKLLAKAAGRDIADDRILCIGDGVMTDLKGALAEGLDCLFVTGGLATAETGGDPERPDPEKLEAFLRGHSMMPRWAIGRLR